MEDRQGVMVTSVEIEIPDLEQAVMDGLLLIVDRALSAADDVQFIIKDVAVLDEKDAFGNPIPHKKPKPPKTPTNLPNAQLIGDPSRHDVPMLDPSRFVVERTGPCEATVTYNPPDYFSYVVEKRPWLLPDRINDDARARIEKLMRDKAEGF
jgi:hypothetical protein